MRARFIASEVGIGLRRNATMTFAVMVTTAISLSLLGIGLLSNAQVKAMKDYWYDKIEVSVFPNLHLVPPEWSQQNSA
jgi:cell division transport system permease protein